jgi:hypothetical protein
LRSRVGFRRDQNCMFSVDERGLAGLSRDVATEGTVSNIDQRQNEAGRHSLRSHVLFRIAGKATVPGCRVSCLGGNPHTLSVLGWLRFFAYAGVTSEVTSAGW